jgi:hypothetical protein
LASEQVNQVRHKAAAEQAKQSKPVTHITVGSAESSYNLTIAERYIHMPGNLTLQSWKY